MTLLSVVIWALVAGWWMPRGPLTIPQALCSVAISAAVGFAAGRRHRTRWVLLIVPAAFVVVVELVRWHVRGPSVDAPHPSIFGILVLLAGRGVQGLLSVLPMVLGVAYGRGVTGRPGRILVTLATAGALLFTAAVAVPARTAPIPGPDSVAELTHVGRLGLMIRGNHVTNPVLLFVPGSPGGSELGAMRRHLAGLEQHFLVATLDRRGGGASYPAIDPTSRVTLDGGVDDILAVADYLRSRFHQDKIYLLAHSGGSILGVLAVQRHPEKFRAYIGTGQAVDLPASDLIFYDDILAWARSTRHDGVVKQLTAQGPPPYRDVYRYEPFMLYENSAYDQRDDGLGLGVREYTLLQKAHTINGLLDTWAALYPRMQVVDLRRDVPALSVPVYFVQGAEEMRGLAELFAQWYPALTAPSKQLIVFPGVGHRAIFEDPDRFVALMVKINAG
jgi:pimeloyl-ACP methyl ester carboxylesterase